MDLTQVTWESVTNPAILSIVIVIFMQLVGKAVIDWAHDMIYLLLHRGIMPEGYKWRAVVAGYKWRSIDIGLAVKEPTSEAAHVADDGTPTYPADYKFRDLVINLTAWVLGFLVLIAHPGVVWQIAMLNALIAATYAVGEYEAAKNIVAALKRVAKAA